MNEGRSMPDSFSRPLWAMPGIRRSRAPLAPRPSAIVIATLVAITLAGCGSAPSRPGTSKPGGYYLDDRPAPNPPENLDSIPEPPPKIHPLTRAAIQAHTVTPHPYTP